MKKISDKKIKTGQSILQCAQDAFLINGYHKTDMSEIAYKAGIDKRTIYRYFSNKEALAFAVWKQVLAQVMNVESEITAENGYGKIEQLLQFYLDKFQANKDVIRFLGEFDHVFSGEYPKVDEADEFVKYIKNNENLMLKYLNEGIYDKSIRCDMDAKLVASTISNIIMSLSQRVVIRGEHLRIEQGYSNELLEQAAELLLASIKNN